MATLPQARIAKWSSMWLTGELATLSKSGRWEEAMNTFSSLAEANAVIQRQPQHYCTVMNACARAGQWEAAFDMFGKFQSVGFPPNKIAYGILINACATAGLADKAQQVIGRMHADKVPVTNYHLNSLISCYSKTGSLQKATQILEHMERQDNETLRPTKHTYSAMTNACAHADEHELAYGMIDRMKKNRVPPTSFNYMVVIDAAAKKRDWQVALKLYDDMKADGIRPTFLIRSSVTTACTDSPVLDQVQAVLFPNFQRKDPHEEESDK